MKKDILTAYETGLKTLKNFVEDKKNIELTETLAKVLAKAFLAEKKVLICGNGGSMSDAMHFAEEFSGKFRKERRPLPALAMSDPAYITCVGNDYGFAEIFSRGIEAFGQNGDVLIVLSTSGNSENIIRAVKKAQKIGLKTIGFLGKNGGKLKGMCDMEFIIPEETSDRIQEIHMMILHIIIEEVERLIFPENY